MNAAWTLSAVGFGLIAVCYGLARFAFGLFLPQVDAELSLSPAVGGLISGGSFLGYCIAIVLGAQLTERFGACAVAIGAALVAAVGMLGIAWAPSAPWLAVSVLVAGSSTGLASPPMASAVAAVVAPARQGLANTVINAGTSAGVALSGPVALMMGAQWRTAFLLFAGVALLFAWLAARAVPRGGARQQSARAGRPPLSGPLARLIVAALLSGAASTALWTFGSQLVAGRPGWDSGDAAYLWIAIGAAGIAGAAAGALIARFGLAWVHWGALLALAAGILMVGLGPPTAAGILGGGMLFGAAYITLTGAYLVWGVQALPGRPASGVMVGFLALAVGQTAGAPLFGLLLDKLSAAHAVAAYASLALLAGLALLQSQRAQPQAG